jgi:hypothetical protein
VLKAVIDTNVWISSLLGTGNPKRIIDAIRSGTLQAVYSKSLFAELLDVLSRPRFASKFTQLDAASLVRLIQQSALLVEVPHVESISRDPKDDQVLACARVAFADFLVTGDEDLLCLGSHGQTRIVTPADFVDVLRSLG